MERQGKRVVDWQIGDRVRIVAVPDGPPAALLGRVGTVRHVWPEDWPRRVVVTGADGGTWGWAFEPEQLESAT